MSDALSVPIHRLDRTADTALRLAAGVWFATLVVGQAIFAATVALFYGLTALRGDVHGWTKHLAHGLETGGPIGNAALIAHLVSAVLILTSGALQFIPRFRRLAPRLHRWNGRVFITTAFIVSLAGLYLLVFRPPPLTFWQLAGNGLMAVLIMWFATMALLRATQRDFISHRRWAFRLFVTVSAALFIRAGAILLTAVLTRGGNADLAAIQGTPFTVLSYAQYAVPLALLELYFWSRGGGAGRRLAMAATLVVMTLVMGGGIAGATAALFVPNLRAAFDPRPSIAVALAETIREGGIDAAIVQFHRLQAAVPRTYNFDEDELNGLGYDLLRTRNYPAAIRILQLNTETYPKSGNTWDSLGEAYMTAGDKPDAISNYRTSLAINPGNANAVAMLRRMGAP